MKSYDIVIIGTGPAGLSAAFELSKDYKILMVEKHRYSSGGLRNDCKQNYTYPIGFSETLWKKDQADLYLERVKEYLHPIFKTKNNISIYRERAAKIGVELLDIDQHHVGTDRAKYLIDDIVSELQKAGVDLLFHTQATEVNSTAKTITVTPLNDMNHPDIPSTPGPPEQISYKELIIAPGRSGFAFLQKIMDEQAIPYTDNIVDIGIRIETKHDHYPIVDDYYDPKFIFPNGVRTFCTNSGFAQVVQEKYDGFYSVNGHAYSPDHGENGLVNFAMLKTITLTAPVASGQKFATILGQAAMSIGGGKPIKQRVGDFRLGKRSKEGTFNSDLYSFDSTLKCTIGDITLAIPSKIMKDIWKAMKMLDTIIPGILNPCTVMYYPEIKCYANRPRFLNEGFEVKEGIYMIGDGAGTSRGITAAWASGLRCADHIRKKRSE